MLRQDGATSIADVLRGALINDIEKHAQALVKEGCATLQDIQGCLADLGTDEFKSEMKQLGLGTFDISKLLTYLQPKPEGPCNACMFRDLLCMHCTQCMSRIL